MGQSSRNKSKNELNQSVVGQNSKFPHKYYLLLGILLGVLAVTVTLYLNLPPPMTQESTTYYPLTGVQIIYDVLERVCGALEVLFGSAKIYFHTLRIEPPPSENENANQKDGPTRFDLAPDLLRNLIRTQLKPKYASQTNETWIQLYSAISSTLTEEEPIQPAAIVILSSPTIKSNLSASLALELAEGVNSIFRAIGYTPPNLSDREGGPPKVLKISKNSWNQMTTVADIHTELNNYLKTNGGKAVVVDSADEINDERQLFVFHGYCDNSHAPDKRATFIFTLTIPSGMTDGGEMPPLVEKNGPKIARAILNDAWTSISGDKRPALITRVAATVVLLQPEAAAEFDD